MCNKILLSPKQEAIKMINSLNDKISMQDIHKEISKLDNSVWKSTVPIKFFVLSGLAAFATFIYFVFSSYNIHGNFKSVNTTNSKIIFLDYILYTFWTIAPPFYFLIEYLKLFPYKLDSNQLADIKYTQELSSKIWAALLFAFGIILYSKYNVR